MNTPRSKRSLTRPRSDDVLARLSLDAGTRTLGELMPITIYRVTWKDSSGEFQQLWTDSYDEAFKKKYEIDHSRGALTYVNFESWFSYRSDEHDRRFGKGKRERGWWQPR